LVRTAEWKTLGKVDIMGYTNTFDSYDSPILVHPGAYFFPKSVENRAFYWGLPFLAIYDTIKTLLTHKQKRTI
jgi:hypothetical protein